MTACLALLSALALLGSPGARAALIDDIEIVSSDDSARVRIQFTVLVRYLRHFPPSSGEILTVFMQPVSGESLRETLGGRIVDEVRRSPRTPLVPCFTVTVVPPANPVRDPIQIVIQFDRAVSYSVRLGDDSRSLDLRLPLPPPGQPPTDCKGKPSE
jgi:hypothetical protein